MNDRQGRDARVWPKTQADEESDRMRRSTTPGWAVAQICCLVLCLTLPGWNSVQDGLAQPRPPAPAPNVGTDLQIQSSVLRIEFDRNLRSRVIALFGPKPEVLTPFSASETVTGVRTWGNFAVTTSRRDRVSDAFGAGERLSLTGKSGELRKDLSVTIYSDFPSIAVFDVTYTN